MADLYFSTDELSVGYNGKALIDHIQIRVERGQILTLIGPNGAGKSTILKSITRQLKLIGGSVYIGGRNMHSMTGNEIARAQAVVFTGRTNSDMMTCWDVVASGRYPYTGRLGILSAEDKRIVREAMELVHTEELENRDFSAISDGQRQRVMLARAICQQPEMILLDEPTSFLDVRHKLEFLSILRKMVREQNIAVIMSLHELDLAQKVSDIVMCVKGDRIDRYGSPEEIFDSDYIQSLYGITTGSYDASFGCMELAPTEGKPEVFVISGGGSGITTFRKLQRDGVPFAAGVLAENDIDYEAAAILATKVVSSPAYEPLSVEAVDEARKIIKQCGKVICTVPRFGTLNEPNRLLMEEAKTAGKLVEYA